MGWKSTKSLYIFLEWGWSDLALFRFLKSYTFLSIRYIFNRSIPKIGNFGPVHAAKFKFPKNQRDLNRLKINIFWEKLQKSSLYLKEQSQNIKLKIKICSIFSYIFQKWAKLFWICNIGNNICFVISFQILLLNKLKNKFCFKCSI